LAESQRAPVYKDEVVREACGGGDGVAQAREEGRPGPSRHRVVGERVRQTRVTVRHLDVNHSEKVWRQINDSFTYHKYGSVVNECSFLMYLYWVTLPLFAVNESSLIIA